MAENVAGDLKAGAEDLESQELRCRDMEAQTQELARLRTTAGSAGGVLAAMRIAAQTSQAQSAESLTLDLTTITPVFGGGTRPGEVDPVVPFRPRAIKNGIRHWWWLLNRHRPEYRVLASDDAQARRQKKLLLYDAMVGIWGGAAREGEDLAAKVSVEMSDITGVRLAPYAAYRLRQGQRGMQLQDDSSDPWLYALFGARGERDPQAQVPPGLQPWEASGYTFAERFHGSARAESLAKQHGLFKLAPELGPDARKLPCALVVPGARFRLTLRWLKGQGGLTNSQQAQILDALAFWLAFGGIGARTSRGLGRLECSQGSFDPWTRIDAATAGNSLPMTLVRAKLGTGDDANDQLRPADTRSPEHSILWLLNAYKRFRQSREPGGERPGRSHWHKAEVVRRADPSYSYRGHRHPLGKQFPQFMHDWLPEILFGAPIVVGFQDKKDDPAETVELVLAEPDGPALNRYNSPLFFGSRRVQLNGEPRWQPQVLYTHALADFVGRKLSMRVKRPGPAGARLKDIPSGTWWIDFDDQANRSAEQRMRTAKFGKLPKPTGGAASLIELFLKQVAAGRGRP
jgi:CRISPR-associated protein Cmr1